MGQPKSNRVDIAGYLAIEQEEDMRYEYHDGEIFAMAGGSINHGRICGNCFGTLRDASRKTGSCEPFTSEVKVEIKAADRYVYPDAGLACPKLNESEHLTGAITNPRLIIEVTSESSAVYDLKKKMEYYFSLPSLLEYILVDQDEPDVTVYRRRGDLMKRDSYKSMEDIVPLESIDASIALTDIYENVEFPPAKKEPGLHST